MRQSHHNIGELSELNDNIFSVTKILNKYLIMT